MTLVRVSFMWPGNHSLQVRSTMDGLSGREGFEKDKFPLCTAGASVQQAVFRERLRVYASSPSKAW